MKTICSEPYRLPDGRVWRARLMTDGRVFRVEWFTPDRKRKRQNVKSETGKPLTPERAIEIFRRVVGDLSALVTVPDYPSNSIARLSDYYVDTVMVARGNRDETRRQNRVMLATITAWLAAQDIVTVDDLADRPDMINRLTVHLLGLWAPYTVATRLSIFRAVFRAAVDDGLIERVPGPARWPSPKIPEVKHPGAAFRRLF